VKIANKWDLAFHLPTQLFHKIKRGGSGMVVTAGGTLMPTARWAVVVVAALDGESQNRGSRRGSNGSLAITEQE